MAVAKRVPKKHKDVNFEVSASGRERRSFYTFDEAAAWALDTAIATGSSTLDVIVWSKSGAKWIGGSDAVEQYQEDPDASVFERYKITVNNQGRIS